MRYYLAATLAALWATPAAAEVVSSGPNHFHIRHTVPLVTSTARAYELLARPSGWWSDAHTYSGSASNLRLELAPGGCYCERWDGKFVKHMEVVAATPGEQIVLEGGLGPLRFAPASGTMIWSVKSAGNGSEVTIDYKVTGFANGDGAAMAVAVDRVLGAQAERLREAAVALPRQR